MSCFIDIESNGPRNSKTLNEGPRWSQPKTLKIKQWNFITDDLKQKIIKF